MRNALALMALTIAGCASTPAPDPCAGLSHHDCSEVLINRAVHTATLAGYDPERVYVSMHRQACYGEARWLPQDTPDRDQVMLQKLELCRKMWPEKADSSVNVTVR